MEKIVAIRKNTINNKVKDKANVKSSKKDYNCKKDKNIITDRENKLKDSNKNNKFCLKNYFCKKRKNTNPKKEKNKNVFKTPFKKRNLDNNHEQNKKNQDIKLEPRNSKLTDTKTLFKKHCKFICSILGLFTLFVIALLLAFVGNPFYDFINRPKILQNISMIIILLLFSGTLCLIEFFINLVYLNKGQQNNEKINQKYKKTTKSKVKNLKPLNNQSKVISFKNLKTKKQKNI